MNKGKKAKGKW